jgi:hypothetical protein
MIMTMATRMTTIIMTMPLVAGMTTGITVSGDERGARLAV